MPLIKDAELITNSLISFFTSSSLFSPLFFSPLFFLLILLVCFSFFHLRENPPLGLLLINVFDVKNGFIDSESEYGRLKSKDFQSKISFPLTLVYDKDLPLELLPSSPFQISISNRWFLFVTPSQFQTKLNGSDGQYTLLFPIETSPLTIFFERKRLIFSWTYFALYLSLLLCCVFFLAFYVIEKLHEEVWFKIIASFILLSFSKLPATFSSFFSFDLVLFCSIYTYTYI